MSRTKKRAVLLTLEYPPMIGGVGNYYARIVEAQPTGKSVIDVIDDSQHALLSESHFTWPKWIRALKTLRTHHRIRSIDCILVGQILPLGTVALIAKFFFGIPYIVMTHAMDVTVPFSPRGKWRHRVLIRYILRYAQAVTTVSHFTAMHLERIGVQQERIEIISPCPSLTPEKEHVTVDEMHALEKRHNLVGKTIILAAGRLVERKGFDAAIFAFERIAQSLPECVLVIVGDGPDRDRLTALVQKSTAQTQIQMVGRCADHELAMWYQRCSVYIMPSRALPNGDSEGFGITYLEANAFCKPVIAGDSGGVRDAVIDGKTGYVIDGEHVDALSQALRELVTNQDRARILGEYGRARVLSDFQWSQRAEQLQRLIENCK